MSARQYLVPAGPLPTQIGFDARYSNVGTRLVLHPVMSKKLRIIDNTKAKVALLVYVSGTRRERR
jgi:hypothetical protein